jgi:hypothetical protein
MASREETRVVNLAGLVQGITLVTFPQPVRLHRPHRVQHRGVSLSSLYGWTAMAAAAMALLSFAVAARQASLRQLHPRPAGHGQPADSAG